MPDPLGRRDSVGAHQLLGAILAKLHLQSITVTEEDLARVAAETVDITSERTDPGLRPGVYVIERTIPRPVIGIHRPALGLSGALDKALRRGPEAGR